MNEMLEGKSVKDIVEMTLRASGFDGLYHPDPDMECGCLVGNLAPCIELGGNPWECKFGYHIPGTLGTVGPRLVKIEGGAACAGQEGR